MSLRSIKLATGLIAVLAVGTTLAVLYFLNRPVEIKTVTMADVRSEAQSGGYDLIDIQKFSTLYVYQSKSVLIVDTRQQWEYGSGHIKGAVNFPMEPTRWARWRNRGDLKSMLGTDKQKSIVFY